MRRRAVAAVQSAVFVGSGLWPVFHLSSFEKVTGPKQERWLVKTVGLLLASIGGGLALAAWKDRVPDEIAAAAALSAASLAGIDLRYGLSRRISPVYLLDGLLQATFVAGWLVARRP